MMTAELELLRDALDHIQRIARGGMNPTKRLDWIELRAKVALRGDQWSRDIRETPDDSRAELIRENKKLREELANRARPDAAKVREIAFKHYLSHPEGVQNIVNAINEALKVTP